jgi:hypothetical protein
MNLPQLELRAHFGLHCSVLGWDSEALGWRDEANQTLGKEQRLL